METKELKKDVIELFTQIKELEIDLKDVRDKVVSSKDTDELHNVKCGLTWVINFIDNMY